MGSHDVDDERAAREVQRRVVRQRRHVESGVPEVGGRLQRLVDRRRGGGVAAGAGEDGVDERVDLHAGLLGDDVDGLVDELVEVPVDERGVVLDGQRELVVGDLGDRRGVEADGAARVREVLGAAWWPRRSRGRASRRRRCPTSRPSRGRGRRCRWASPSDQSRPSFRVYLTWSGSSETSSMVPNDSSGTTS